ncbi:MAG: DNA methyltransferase [Burkholderiaceae bacterium]
MPLSWNEIKSRALAFSRTWADAANEDSQGKPFWIDFFEIFGITDKRVGTFEHAVKKLLGDKAKVDGFVDLFWPGMLLVEQKSRGKNLDAAMTQALSYFPGIAERDLPQIIIVCDFARFRVHRLATGENFEFNLADLHKNIKLFGFIAGYKAQVIQPQNPVNIKAAERMGKLHDALKASGYTDHPLEVLLVRLLFCLFADDTGIFQPAAAFRTYIEERTAVDGSDLGSRLAQLFQTLNTDDGNAGVASSSNKRSKVLDEQVAAFPYVNGKLFDESLPMADFNSAMREALLDACALDWSAISPAIFGSLFQSIMDDKARRNLGAHYTSEENILKLIKPLFLDELWAEFDKVKNNRNRLFEFHKKLRSLTFFDPACGCGNFLVISYRELRELELAVLRASAEKTNASGQLSVDVHTLLGVNVDQFYGIEIEEFPAQIAQVALWLMDHQVNLRVSEEFGQYFARIPLRTTPHVVHGNALTIDWETVLPAANCSFVLGNPPFLGKQHQSTEQKADVAPLFDQLEGGGVLDFVAAWYIKAANYLRSVEAGQSSPRCAFVSTNSIIQGEQVGVLWSWMLSQNMHIRFAHRTFRWSNEASGKAAVHCVIIGFGTEIPTNRVIYEYDDVNSEPHATPASNINPYLVDAINVVLPSRRTSICDVLPIVFGSMANDGGHLFLDNAEKATLLAECPAAAKWIRPFLGADEFINNIPRWCLWLKDCPPAELRSMPAVMARVQKVKENRSASNRPTTKALSTTPTLFGEIRQPTGEYLLIPRHSSERREFIPIGFLPPEVIVGDANLCVPNAKLFHFGIMTSRMHMAWVKYVCGRIKSDYRYTNSIVYNNFPWPELPKNEAKTALAGVSIAYTAIENAAKTVLYERAKHQTGDNPASLADLYDPLTMPPALLKAHQKLDAAVDKAYEASGGKKAYKSDAERVAFLFDLYQRMTSLLPADAGKPKRRAKLAG